MAVGWVHMVPKFWVFLGGAACLLAISGLGIAVVVGWAGEVSLASASLVGTSVYLTGYMVRGDGLDLPFLVGLGAGMVVAAALHSIAALATAKLSGIYVMVLTLGLQVTIERTVFSVSKLTGGAEGVYLSRPSFLGLHFDSDTSFYYLCLGALAMVVVFLTLFRQSRHGRAMLLVRTNREAAAAVGISPWRYKILAFVICGLLLGLAGGMTAPLYRSPPTLLQYLSFASLFLLAVPVTAGSESLISVIIVAFAFTMLPAGPRGAWPAALAEHRRRCGSPDGHLHRRPRHRRCRPRQAPGPEGESGAGRRRIVGYHRRAPGGPRARCDRHHTGRNAGRGPGPRVAAGAAAQRRTGGRPGRWPRLGDEHRRWADTPATSGQSAGREEVARWP